MTQQNKRSEIRLDAHTLLAIKDCLPATAAGIGTATEDVATLLVPAAVLLLVVGVLLLGALLDDPAATVVVDGVCGDEVVCC